MPRANEREREREAQAGGRTADSKVAGNLLGKKPRWLKELGAAAENYLHDPWQPGAIEAIKPDENILLIGMGLTAVDKLVELDLQKHKGTIYANSRHGLWPSPHVARLVSHGMAWFC